MAPRIPTRLLAAILLVTSPLTPQGAAAPDPVDFNREVRPILAGRCIACHGPAADKRKGGPKGSGGLRLDTQAGSRMDLGGAFPVVPGRPDQSELIRRVTATDGDRMPPRSQGEGLSAAEIDILRRWIAGGGEYARHWAFVPPTAPAVPEVRERDWPRNPIDHFVARRLEPAGLAPSPAADRATLWRRVCLDLTGLPPSPEQLAAFLADDRPDAYERGVDRLLASTAYGEHQARHWLDLARYADSAGYADDPRRTIWAYRDWVIRAFNRNLPFDRFTIEQLAGDLLPDPTQDQRIATAFHRNTMTNSEGGTDDEEFRTVAVVDRVNTTMAVWMGTTMGCAQCHDHKFDPISQREYYEFLAFFNTTEDSDKRDERPTLPVYDEAQLRERERLQATLAELRGSLAADPPAVRAEFDRWVAAFPRDVAWRPARLVAGAGGAVRRLAVDLPTVTAVRAVAAGKGGLGLTLVPERARPTPARYVRIELPGKRRILSLAEVQVLVGDHNVARAGQARQSSTDFDGPARLAIDGNTDGRFEQARSTTHTATSDDPWWELDLGGEQPIDRLVVWNRAGSAALRDRLRGFRLALLDRDRRVVFRQQVATAPDPQVAIDARGARAVGLGAGFPAAGTADGEEVRVLARPVSLAGARLELRSGDAPALRLAVTDAAGFAPYAEVPADVLGILARPAAERTADQARQLRAYHRSIAASLQPLRERIAATEQALAGSRPRTTVPVMREQAGARRATHVHLRGNFLNKGEPVACGVPAVFHPLPADAPRDRLALARWLVSPANPLTARVTVNRFWELLFGRGLVATSEDFGSRGDLPSHPQLLDWLATRFVASGWDVKALLRLIVTSATYRQSSTGSAGSRQRDPDNRWLGRGPRFRLSAEMIRDQALAVSGLLSRQAFGPPVRPPRPNLGLRAAFGGSTDWQDSTGEDRYRRGIYTLWQRSIPYPSMAVFDAPSREVCTVRREPTNTPLQALVTLNDPVFVEAAQALARRMLRDGGATTAERLAYGIRRCLARPATAAELRRLQHLVEHATARYRAAPAAAAAMATEPLGPAPAGTEVAELAAWTVVANVLLNLDEFLVKR